MPKETFFNLGEEKRYRIIDAALQEFEEQFYDNASINRIIAGAQIPKGSFYQYFEDKKDLYKYVIELMGEEKMKYISPVLENPFAHGFAEVLRETYRLALDFARDNPRYMKLANRFVKDKNHPIYKEVIGENIDRAIDIYKLLLLKGIKSKDLREDINLELTARIIVNISTSLMEYYEDIEIDKWIDKMYKEQEDLISLLINGLKEGNNDKR